MKRTTSSAKPSRIDVNQFGPCAQRYLRDEMARTGNPQEVVIESALHIAARMQPRGKTVVAMVELDAETYSKLHGVCVTLGADMEKLLAFCVKDGAEQMVAYE